MSLLSNEFRTAPRVKRHVVQLMMLLSLSLYLVNAGLGQDKAEKIEGSLEVAKVPLPSALAQANARKAIRELFKKEFDQGKKPKGKIGLAQALLTRTAELQDDPASLYAVLAEAAENAAAGGDVTLALKAITEVDEHFATPAFELKEKVAKLASSLAKTPGQILPLIEMHQKLIREALDNDDIATAERVSLGASVLARKTDLGVLKDQLQATSKEVGAFKAAFKTADSAHQALKTQPENRSANLMWGKYVCFTKGDWINGLPILAKSQDAVLSPLAKRDLEHTADSDENVVLGDDWWTVSDKETDLARTAIQVHALECYYRALPGLSGASLTTTERKISRIFGGSRIYSSTGEPMGIPIADASLTLGAIGTIECWVQTLANENVLFSKRGQEQDGTLGILLRGGRATLIENASFHWGENASDVVLNDRVWHHVAIVKTVSKATLFIDGKQASDLDVREELPSKSPWTLGASFAFAPIIVNASKFRISNTARYVVSFKPDYNYKWDKATMYLSDPK